MKKLIVLTLILIGITACENQPWSFEDYNLQAVYFPIQTPLRTLSLGEDRVDNTLDREYKLDIGVSIGGMYSNKKNWTVDYKVDTGLTTRVYLYAKPQNYNKFEKVKYMPSSYYTLEPTGTVAIPSGSFNGLIRVNLTSAFFDDTLAITGQYVIPLKITASSADSILSGRAAISNADPRILSDWNANQSPKDWVMYGINYVNAYHGTWLHRGRDVRLRTSTGVRDTIKFHAKYVEKDILTKLTTVGRAKVKTNSLANLSGATYGMILTFANDKGTPGNVTISSAPGIAYAVTGTGTYQDIATSKEQWTGLTWQSMYLSYTYNDGTYTHTVNDSLVFRDRGLKFMTNSIVVKP